MHKLIFLARPLLGVVALTALVNASLSHAAAPEEQHETVSGVAQKVDSDAGKSTLKHGPIKNLGMNEEMTTVFAVQGPDMLKGLKAGDKVKFEADRVNGRLTVSKIDKTK